MKSLLHLGVYPDLSFMQKEKKAKPKKEQNFYTFKVNSFKDINFNEIQDDLSYNDPLRIVEYNNKHIAVVHHSIINKYEKSNLKFVIHNSIIRQVNEIEPEMIKDLIIQISRIKQGEWSNKFKKTRKKKHIVTVKKVKIDF